MNRLWKILQKFVEKEEPASKELIVQYKENSYDLTDFLKKHPGGANLLKGFNGKDIQATFEETDHSHAASYLLQEYKMNKISDVDGKSLDESLEYLVDWNSAMLPQISKIGDKYVEWVNKPVDRQMKLFSNQILESLTKTPWYLPLLVWVPISALSIFNEIASERIESFISLFRHLVGGVFSWTLIEYLLHRFVFHLNVKKHPSWATFHFMLHGLHHKVPFDPYRLVFPPVPAAIIAILFYQPVHLIESLFQLYNSRLIFSGIVIGYLCYDMIHYYIHHSGSRNKYFYHLKRYHNHHHFLDHEKGFGISSILWDLIFGTEIVLRKLKYLIKW